MSRRGPPSLRFAWTTFKRSQPAHPRPDLTRIGGLAPLARALKDAGLAGEARANVMRLAASMWVDAEVASRLAALIAQPEDAEPFAAALNGKRISWSPRMVAWRALLPNTDDFVYRVAGGGSDNWENELIAQIRKAFRAGREDDIDDDEQVDEVLRDRTAPIVYVLPPPIPDEALLRSLRKRYPRVTFIVHTGARLPAPGDVPGVVVLSLPAWTLRPRPSDMRIVPRFTRANDHTLQAQVLRSRPPPRRESRGRQRFAASRR